MELIYSLDKSGYTAAVEGLKADRLGIEVEGHQPVVTAVAETVQMEKIPTDSSTMSVDDAMSGNTTMVDALDGHVGKSSKGDLESVGEGMSPRAEKEEVLDMETEDIEKTKSGAHGINPGVNEVSKKGKVKSTENGDLGKLFMVSLISFNFTKHCVLM